MTVRNLIKLICIMSALALPSQVLAQVAADGPGADVSESGTEVIAAIFRGNPLRVTPIQVS